LAEKVRKSWGQFIWTTKPSFNSTTKYD